VIDFLRKTNELGARHLERLAAPAPVSGATL